MRLESPLLPATRNHRARWPSFTGSPNPTLPMKFGFLRLVFVLGLLSSLCSGTASPPNVIIFYADDLGWGEITAQGFARARLQNRGE